MRLMRLLVSSMFVSAILLVSAGLACCTVAQKWPYNAGDETDAAEEEEPEGFMCYGQPYNPKKDKELPTKVKSEDWHKRNGAVRVFEQPVTMCLHRHFWLDLNG
jgi:hypothetical protein